MLAFSTISARLEASFMALLASPSIFLSSISSLYGAHGGDFIKHHTTIIFVEYWFAQAVPIPCSIYHIASNFQVCLAKVTTSTSCYAVITVKLFFSATATKCRASMSLNSHTLGIAFVFGGKNHVTPPSTTDGTDYLMHPGSLSGSTCPTMAWPASW